MSTSEKDKRLLAIEAVSQAMRAYRLDPEAIEGICRHAELFKEIGMRCRSGRITAYELDAFIERHIKVWERSVAHDYERHHRGAESWHMAAEIMKSDSFIHPYAIECAFRGNVHFTREQLEQLHRIPYSAATLREERARGAILFPGHPDITLGYLLEVLGPEIGALVHFRKPEFGIAINAEERVNERLKPAWYLIRLKPEPLVEEASFVEQARRVDEATHRMPHAVEFATTVLLAVWRIWDEDYDWRIEEFSKGPLAQFGAWCVDKDRVLRPTKADPTKQELADARWVVGPYVGMKETGEPGLHLRRLEEAKRERTAQLFLVRKPDASAEGKQE